jgi:hypothetical protein
MAEEQAIFLGEAQSLAKELGSAVATESGDWVVKGFVDVYRQVYALSPDTKVISKVLELLLYPKMAEFAANYGYDLALSGEQNYYPDLTFVDKRTGLKFALDMKTTYRVSEDRVNGMTLGAYTGYFRTRTSRKMTVFPYGDYSGHFVLGVIYSKIPPDSRSPRVHGLGDLEQIRSVIREFEFFAQPKYRIASSRPGSGNTKNIGSVTGRQQLVDGTGPFATLGEMVFDDYWMFYLSKDMARAADLPEPPYNDIVSYVRYRCACPDIDPELAARLQEIDTGPPVAEGEDE